jgi:hypothetical protein
MLWRIYETRITGHDELYVGNLDHLDLMVHPVGEWEQVDLACQIIFFNG